VSLDVECWRLGRLAVAETPGFASPSHDRFALSSFLACCRIEPLVPKLDSNFVATGRLIYGKSVKAGRSDADADPEMRSALEHVRRRLRLTRARVVWLYVATLAVLAIATHFGFSAGDPALAEPHIAWWTVALGFLFAELCVSTWSSGAAPTRSPLATCRSSSACCSSVATCC
jgi:hypothetical protein